MSDIISFNTNDVFNFGTRIEQKSKCSGYGLAELIKDIEKPVGLEIGCDIGDTTVFLLESQPNLLLTSIDPYENYVDWNGRPLHERQEVFENAMNRLDKFSNRFSLVKQTSDDAVDVFEEEEFDFIFIDGLHTYDQLSKDCLNYYSKLKPGGIFSGHDFTAIPGVHQAATEFAAKVGKEILTTECDVWYWYK